MSVLRCNPDAYIRYVLIVFLLASLSPSASSQTSPPTVSVQVHADQSDGTIAPIWNYFGYDEPNYTYAPNGRKLLGELAALEPRAGLCSRPQSLDHRGWSASLKWGSTNVYTEDAQGKPVYSWTILDRIFDSFHDSGSEAAG